MDSTHITTSAAGQEYFLLKISSLYSLEISSDGKFVNIFSISSTFVPTFVAFFLKQKFKENFVILEYF